MFPDPSNPELFAKSVLEALTAGNFRFAAALLVVAAVFFGGKLLSKKAPFFGTSKGKAILNISVVLIGGAAMAFTVGRPPTLPEVLAAVSTAFTAAGGWSLLKAFFE